MPESRSNHARTYAGSGPRGAPLRLRWPTSPESSFFDAQGQPYVPVEEQRDPGALNPDLAGENRNGRTRHAARLKPRSQHLYQPGKAGLGVKALSQRAQPLSSVAALPTSSEGEPTASQARRTKGFEVYGSSSPGEATSVSPPAIVKGFATREKLLLLRVRGNCADPAASGISSAGARVAVCMASPAVRPFLLFRSPGSPRVPTGAQALQARKQGAFLLLAVAPRQSPPRREGKEGKRGSTLGFFSLSDASEETARARRTGLPYPNKGSSRQGAAATPWLLKLW